MQIVFNGVVLLMEPKLSFIHLQSRSLFKVWKHPVPWQYFDSRKYYNGFFSGNIAIDKYYP